MGTSTSLPSLLPRVLLPLFFFMAIANAQVTDPDEAKALNIILQRWGFTLSSNDPCNDGTYNDTFNEKFIVCNCSTANCHITEFYSIRSNFTGPIPQELQSLTHLEVLDIGSNYLTGPIPAFIGNFTQLRLFSVGSNALTGPIPKELGNLKKPQNLKFATNFFSGTIPPELGGLINLEYWYMDSSGLSGELPSELSNLVHLKAFWASDNNFTGKLPAFFGSFKNLTDLRLHGNSFEGPIPPSFSNLTNMNHISIDITRGTESSTLQFISEMKDLYNLMLRNCKISGALPLDFSQYNKLQHIDLSFNSITGPIPQSLFSMSQLQFLFLGNNNLSGSLPTQKSSSLSTVDLSYNQLAGSFPPWVGEPNLQLNLVANNFVISESNSSGLPAGLRCLQNDRPCYRDPPFYHSFAVNCGGSRTITASDKIDYEKDSANLTSASYYVTDQMRWAVSSVGYPYVDKLNSLRGFKNTPDSELFQSSRLSTSTLRYYGLGLKNGNYTIKLQFAETQFNDGPTFTSVGRRIFDIYIQGDLKEKNFDIRKEAGGTAYTALEKEYTASVTSNFLEIHLFWAGKGTCCVPSGGYHGPSVSAISVSLKDFILPAQNKPPGSSSLNHTGLAVGLAVGTAALLLLCLIILRIRRKKVSREDNGRGNSGVMLHGIVEKAETFSYAEMKIATCDFSSSNLLGEGGYGPVFKGNLSDGRIVAVKQLSVKSSQGKRQFMAEIKTISAVQHCNLVKLLGYCVEGDTYILVYEFLENKSLDQAIWKGKLHIDWPRRFEICLGVARGLAYLHEESSVPIIHRDVKASNILLDADLNPKISDFGLARLFDEQKTHVSTNVAGTIGYLAPEYAMRGHLTKKVDVYAFGVLCLEIIAGRPNSDLNLEAGKNYLLEWTWYLRENKRELELVDRSLSSFNEDEVGRVISVALLCTQTSLAQRPPMSQVVAMLAGYIEVTEVTMKPSHLDWQNYTDDTGSIAPDNTRTSSQGTRPMSSPSAVDSLLNSFNEGRR